MKLVAVMLAIALTACGAGGTEDVWEDPDGVLFRIESEGGFAPVEWLLRRGPVYTLMTDGRLISEGVVIAIFPGPLVPPYQVTMLTEGETTQIREMIERMGLPGMTHEIDDSAANFVADATTETIVYRDANGTHRYSVYALGLTEDRPSSEATRVFAELRSILDEIAATRESSPYTPERVRVLAGAAVINSEFEDLRPWPLSDTELSGWDELNDTWSCRAFEGEVLDLFTDATETTTWTNPTPGADDLTLLVRGLHPGEDDCPGE